MANEALLKRAREYVDSGEVGPQLIAGIADFADAQLRQMAPYLRHQSWCKLACILDVGNYCDCGLDAKLRELGLEEK